ncbi:AraC family transcriptional regulator [Acetatifactor muris]|uniref:Melibiose operon regulatory protein n=1 Tax=Acetatifactor muris TaxID=879566 RepID=A0A2K4ZAD8_9FIRM|nr:AraC family transcriptional regulator [Acetatifactor muris]MCI8801273.1 AraC family transcriptional regulator [Lachnospiraceae bacterium]MCR2047512.1 AraC family transcriptional regulator [Acetatifactor muris]SOY27409.1 Melibiose operon regulatory protein [Acetatifactor muris]
MKPHNGAGKTITDESLREMVRHGSEEYPFQYYVEDPWMFDFHCIDWHWHPEVEFVYVEKGMVECLVGSDRHLLSAGTGIFINSQVIHRMEATESAIVPNIVFSPALLSPEESLVYRNYIQPILNSSLESYTLSPNAGQNEVLDTLLSVFILQESGNACEMETVELLLKLWRMMYENMEITESISAPRSSVRTQAQLQIMMQFIHKNYSRQISLDDIAETVTLSKSSVLNLFNKNIHTSPINYLVNYRLKRAAKLLMGTEDSVSAIARDTGFENIGYFCRKFKETFQVTPGEYRKSHKLL